MFNIIILSNTIKKLVKSDYSRDSFIISRHSNFLHITSIFVLFPSYNINFFTECMSTYWTIQLPDLLLILHVYKLIELSNCLTCCSSNKSINWLNCPNCLMCCSSNKSINWLPWSCNKSINWLSWSPGLGLIMYILTTLDFPTHKLTTSVNAKYYYLQTDWTVQLLGLLLIQHVTIAV